MTAPVRYKGNPELEQLVDKWSVILETPPTLASHAETPVGNGDGTPRSELAVRNPSSPSWSSLLDVAQGMEL